MWVLTMVFWACDGVHGDSSSPHEDGGARASGKVNTNVSLVGNTNIHLFTTESLCGRPKKLSIQI